MGSYSSTQSCACPKPKHCHKLPVVKGNLKYPNRQFHADIQNAPERPLSSNKRDRNFCMQTCDYDIRKEQKTGNGIQMDKVIPLPVKKDDAEKDKDTELESLKKQCPKGIEVVSFEHLKTLKLQFMK